MLLKLGEVGGVTITNRLELGPANKRRNYDLAGFLRYVIAGAQSKQSDIFRDVKYPTKAWNATNQDDIHIVDLSCSPM
jgi:hypothetical protein